MTEAELIDSLHHRARRLGIALGNGIVTGIGDDCAVFRARGSTMDLVFTADMMHEGVHFTWDEGPAVVGHKALARSLSDCAAMGARPLFCLLSLAFPAQSARWADEFHGGFCKLAKRFHTIIAGGDLSNTERISCDVTVCGEVPRGRALLRSKAKVNEVIYVSGPLGRAALALETRSSFLPEPRVDLGRCLQKLGARCAMDLSDGLSTDLARLCLASRVAASLDNIPVARGATPRHALHGGEDYELLFTLARGVDAPKGCVAIGRTIRGAPGQVLLNGQPLRPQGWDHFRPR